VAKTGYAISGSPKGVNIYYYGGTEGLAFTLTNSGGGNNNAYSVSKGTVTDGAVVIPAVYNTLPVTEIAVSAFNGTDISSVSIPSSVTSIGVQAFWNCVNLTSVKFEGTIPEAGFPTGVGSGGVLIKEFLGDLRDKFYATNPTNGTPGTYTTTIPINDTAVWTRQP